jgi:alkylhydroperoxidase/carboxymuconolactone decarboxylase family protein YurZ
MKNTGAIRNIWSQTMTNSRLMPLPAEDWEPSLAPILDDMDGEPINVQKLMAHNPELLQAWWSFRNHSVRGGSLGSRLSELVILRVAIHMRAWYEWASHVDRALAVGISLEEIERVKQGAAATGWTEQESVALAAVDDLIGQNKLGSTTLGRLKQHFSIPQILDLIAIQGMYVILGGMINSFGLDLDDTVRDRLPVNINREAFELEFSRT